MATYQVLVTTMAGVPYAELANVEIESITWELNGWGEAILRMPVNDSQARTEMAAEYQTRREIQIWRNGRLIWWGVYVAGDADDQFVRFTCFGLLWYFSRRYFGPVHTNTTTALLTNGTFEHATVTTGWSVTAGVTASGSTTRRRTGSKSIKLVTSGSGVTDYYIAQAVAMPTPARIKPLVWTASAWQYRESVTAQDFWDRALVITRVDGGGVSIDPFADSLAKPDEELGRWVYREASVTIPAGATGNMGIALYAPAAGTVYWEDAVLTYQQRTGAVEGEDWSDDYLRRIFNYGAGNTGGGSEGPGGSVIDQKSWWGARVNKSSLNMTWTGSGSAAGSLRADAYWDHADEGNIFEAIADLARRNIVDFEITWATNGRSRTFTTYAPRKGSTKNGLAAELGRNIVSFRYAVDGRARANDVRVPSRAPATVRETGQAGGPTVSVEPQLEAIISPASEIEGQALIDLATSEQARRADAVRMPTITVHAGPYMGDTQPGGTAEAGAPITVGDSIPVRMSHGWVQENATRRIVRMTLRPATETLDLVVNA
jgi:hypothetical protein